MAKHIVEKQFNDYLSKLIYAVFEDIKKDWNGTLKHSDLMYQNYENVCKDKKDKGDGLKARFTISDPVKQFMAFMFARMLEEVSNVKAFNTNDWDDIVAALVDANAECYTQFMSRVAKCYAPMLGKVVLNANDTTNWFSGRILGALPQYAARPVLIAVITEGFNAFVKSLAFIFGKLLWYYEASISENLFLGTFAQQGMSQDMLDIMQSGLRAKTPAKPRTSPKKNTTAAPTDVVLDAAPIDVVPTDAATDVIPEHNSDDVVPAKAAAAPAGEFDDLLLDI